MTEFSEGDLIEATKTEIASSTRFRGVLKSTGWENGFILQAQGYEPELSWLETQGFTLTLIEKAAPALPTEPGLYRLDNGMVVERLWDGAWISPNGSNGMVQYVHESATHIPVAPVADTAKKVIDFIDSLGFESNIHHDAANRARREFGVTHA